MQVITNLQIVHDIDKQERLEQEDSTERIFGDKGRCEDIYEMVLGISKPKTITKFEEIKTKTQ